ncbi:hypothetical protein GY45DRAFT_1160622 [Cubamyces sp. BRFM 1775]|nr:hypothetical protein GY45DRAFT_1160622 [Cubamyces sp. BRFM 1775]
MLLLRAGYVSEHIRGPGRDRRNVRVKEGGPCGSWGYRGERPEETREEERPERHLAWRGRRRRREGERMWLARRKYKLVGIIYRVQVKSWVRDVRRRPWTHAHPISIRPDGGGQTGDSQDPSLTAASQPIHQSFLSWRPPLTATCPPPRPYPAQTLTTNS